jgi:integrase
VANLRLGSRPFRAAIPIYLEATRGRIKESTRQERKRKLILIGRELEVLKSQKRLLTTDPRHLNDADVLAFKEWMMMENYGPGTQKKMLFILKSMLEHFDNRTFDTLEQRGIKMPSEPNNPIRTFTESDLFDFLRATYDLKNEWHGQILRGAMAMYWATMRRPSEIRNCKLSDLNMNLLILHIEKPKGSGKWVGETDTTIFRDDMVPYLSQYLKDRQQMLKKKGIRSDALFPTTKGHSYSMQGLNRIKNKIEVVTGKQFFIKDFRSSSASDMLNVDSKLLPVVSAQLGHTDPATTQRYYARIEAGKAGNTLREALNEAKKHKDDESFSDTEMTKPNNEKVKILSPVNNSQKPVINKSFEMSGYQ